MFYILYPAAITFPITQSNTICNELEIIYVNAYIEYFTMHYQTWKWYAIADSLVIVSHVYRSNF